MPPLMVIIILAALPTAPDRAAPQDERAAVSAAQEPGIAPQSPTQPDEAPSAPQVIPIVTIGTVFDSNINHDAEDLDSYGTVLGVGAIFRNNASQPTLEVEYQAGLHHYTNTNRWNRLSHFA